MVAKFYIADELKTVREKAIEIAALGVANFYRDVSPEYGRALFFTCMRLWKLGPTITCARLNSNIRPQTLMLVN